MKKARRLAVLSVILTAAVISVGCGGRTARNNPFSVFSDGFDAVLSVEINGNASKCRYEKGSEQSVLTFILPSELCGVSFTLSGSSVTLKSGETEISANERIAFLPRLISSVFSEKSDGITEIKAENTDGKVITAVKTASAVYRFDRDGAPLGAEGVLHGATFKITVNELCTVGGTSSAPSPTGISGAE